MPNTAITLFEISVNTDDTCGSSVLVIACVKSVVKSLKNCVTADCNSGTFCNVLVTQSDTSAMYVGRLLTSVCKLSPICGTTSHRSAVTSTNAKISEAVMLRYRARRAARSGFFLERRRVSGKNHLRSVKLQIGVNRYASTNPYTTGKIATQTPFTVLPMACRFINAHTSNAQAAMTQNAVTPV